MFLKHKLYKDVCFQVLSSVSVRDRIKLKVLWWNLGYVNSYCMGIKQHTEIYRFDYCNWLCTNDMVSCLRNANWKELT